MPQQYEPHVSACDPMQEMDVNQAEALFGSDEAIGIQFVLDETGESLSWDEYDEQFASIPVDQRPNGQSVLPHGGSAVCCTDYAHHIKLTLTPSGHHVDVVGFANEDNPESLCAIEEYHPGGHDFAIVDGRYLIDPWVRLVVAVEDQIFYDLENPVDLEKAVRIYGPREKWLSLLDAQEVAVPAFA